MVAGGRGFVGWLSVTVHPMSEFAYLTTRGRRTGRPHTIEIWYAQSGDTVYLLSGRGERADWVKNLRQDPRVEIRLGGPRTQRADLPGTRPAVARVVVDLSEEHRARRLMASKYQGWREGQPLSEWARESLVVAVDLGSPTSGGAPYAAGSPPSPARAR